ncbi:MAG: hypothetical protein AB3N23_08985 [Paracoccaceae bacterium]
MTKSQPLARSFFTRAFMAAMTLLPTHAQADQTAMPGVSIELSAADDVDGACRMSFLIINGHGKDIEQAVYEIVLFSGAGGVAQLTLLDFRDLPASRPRVRQFQFDGLACADIPRVLINGSETCTGVAEGGCINNLILTTRTGTELIG